MLSSGFSSTLSWAKGSTKYAVSSTKSTSNGVKSFGGFARFGGNSGLYQSRRYASKSSGDLFEGALQGGEAVKGGEGKEASVLKPRIPVQREKVEGQQMRSHYKHKLFLESVAHKRRVPTSMKKVWHEARAIRRLPVKKALSFLEIHPTRSSKHLYSAVRQAKINAVWRGFREEDLEISKVVIGKGKYLKRIMTHAKGRAGRVTHPFHHLSVFVRPTKKALKEAAQESQIAGTEASMTGNASTSATSTPVEPIKNADAAGQKKGGWWPFGKKEEASL